MSRNTNIRGDRLYVHIPQTQNQGTTTLPVSTGSGRRTVRPLPRPPHPQDGDGTPPAQRSALQRRSSSGGFVNAGPRPKKKPTFFVANPSTSPISPDTPKLHHSAPYPSLHALPVNIIPPTPLSHQPPPLVHSPLTALSPPMPDTPSSPRTASSPDTRSPLSTKTHRFGKSVGSIPESVLADLRSAPERKAPSRANTLPVDLAEGYSDSSDNDDEDDMNLEAYTYTVETATRVSRLRSKIPPEWEDTLGGDRWVASRYSSILRTL
ncbi:hypothetical protein DFH08DRAFT_980885 [Mycena albidolilacea]|uniref:Uncharacterized protein n=1 Tax=Mycena albidolilacea TaxID=1033008 RepID=A0AAD7F4A1_9AGAR|nr:hypothetical protein DFH08DRAFT_980885 [Mycena albidolilacea]